MGEIIVAPAKKRRSLQPLSIVAREQKIITVPSHQFNLGVIDAMREGNEYKILKLSETVTVPTAQYVCDKGHSTIVVKIELGQGEGIDNLKSAIMGLGDGVVDTWLSILAIGLKQNGYDPTRIRVPFMINPDDILALCQKEKSGGKGGSYTTFQRADIIKHIKILSQVTVCATQALPPSKSSKKQEPTYIKASGPLLDLHKFTIGEYKLITGDEMWERREMCLGPFIADLVAISPLTATVFRQVLKYSAKNQKFQKRLGQYISMMFRINAKYGLVDNVGIFQNDITMEKLLEGAHIPFQNHPHPTEFKDAIERALQQIKADGVIGDYWQIVESVSPENAEKIQTRAKGWFAIWLQTKWNVTAPHTIQEQYAELAQKAQKAHLRRIK